MGQADRSDPHGSVMICLLGFSFPSVHSDIACAISSSRSFVDRIRGLHESL
jgi:hypothetical protein